jgi:hypothetical protein
MSKVDANRCRFCGSLLSFRGWCPNGLCALSTGIVPPASCLPPRAADVEDVFADSNPKDIIGATKPPLHLVPASALLYEAKVMALGAKKYGPYNWRGKPVRYTIYVSAAMRHLLAALDGQRLDPESGQPHLAHARACLGILLDAEATGNLIDDRPAPGAAAELIETMTERKEPVL